jgi:hypothetical protein
MTSARETIATLTQHRENLLAAKTWQEYREAHVLYVDHLIERARIQEAALASIDKFSSLSSDFISRTRWQEMMTSCPTCGSSDRGFISNPPCTDQFHQTKEPTP